MSVIFKFIFERATDPLCLPINPIYEYAILVVIALIAYGIAYNKVGDMYHGGLIRCITEGSFFHWLIRGFLFMALWLSVYGAIQLYYFVLANLKTVLMISGCVAGTALLCVMTVTTMSFLSKHSTANGNARKAD